MTPEFLLCAFPFTLLLEIIPLIILICNLRPSKKCPHCNASSETSQHSETVLEPSMVLHVYDDVILDAFYPETVISPTLDKSTIQDDCSTATTPNRRLVPPMILHVYDDAILDAFYPTYVDESTDSPIPDKSTIPLIKSLEVDELQHDESLLSLLPTAPPPAVVKEDLPLMGLFSQFPYPTIDHGLCAGMSPALRTARQSSVHSFHSFMREIIFFSAYLGDVRALSKSLPKLTALPSQDIILHPRGQEMFSSQLIFHGKPTPLTKTPFIVPMHWLNAADITFLIVTLQNPNATTATLDGSNQLQPAVGSLVSQAAHIEDIKKSASFVLMSANSQHDDTVVPLLRQPHSATASRKKRNWLDLNTLKKPISISALALQSKLLVVSAKPQPAADQQDLLQTHGEKAEEIVADEDSQSTTTSDTYSIADETLTNDDMSQRETCSKQMEQLEELVSALIQQVTAYREEMTNLLHNKDHELKEVKQKLFEHMELIAHITADKKETCSATSQLPQPDSEQQQLATALKKKEEELQRLNAYLENLLERVIAQAPHVLEIQF